MVFVSTSVVRGSCGQVLLNWEIIQCHSQATIRDFFKSAILPKLNLELTDQIEVYIFTSSLAFKQGATTSFWCYLIPRSLRC